MKRILMPLALCVLLSACGNPSSETTPTDPLTLNPISHATAYFEWDGFNFYLDPTGGPEAFASYPEANLILVTDIHGDHFNLETLEAVTKTDTQLLVPEAVYNELPESLIEAAKILQNGETWEWNGFTIEALPMYNLPESDDSYHVKGRGNGYLIEKEQYRFYIAGDSAGIPEMRSLKNIDYALVPMNLPYTMAIEEAAEAVLEFAPAKVTPYHYRGTDGLSDIDEFKNRVESANESIKVELLDWYPEN